MIICGRLTVLTPTCGRSGQKLSRTVQQFSVAPSDICINSARESDPLAAPTACSIGRSVQVDGDFQVHR